MVRYSIQKCCSRIGRVLLCTTLVAVFGNMVGCEVNSFFDPSRTGAYNRFPTTIPVLDRLDVIEQEEDHFSRASSPSSDDLLPRDLSYFLYPGDTVTVGIFELYQPNIWYNVTRQIDAGGYYRVPELGDVRAAGLTSQQFEDELIRQLAAKVMQNPQVDVVVERAGGLRYTVFGFVQNWGVFNLTSPDLRLLDALAIAGGAPLSTERVFVIRQVILSDEVLPSTDPNRRGAAGAATRPREQRQPVDVEDLINQLDKDKGQSSPTPPSRNRQTPPNAPSNPPQDQLHQPPQNPPGNVPPGQSNPRVSPGMLPGMAPQDTRPMVDIDQLEPVRPAQKQPPVDVDTIRPQTKTGDDNADSWIYVQERGEWVRMPGGAAKRPANGRPSKAPAATAPGEPELIVERVIRIDYKSLLRGDSSQNIVIRPNDRIYVDGPSQGFVYIDGEIARPGVFQLPNSGTLTLSRLVAAAGGFAPIAIPERVDLTRKVGNNREATVRLDLAAIRHRTEPDVVLKPDDYISIGTNWIATPLAIIRNGFRATYGFGFILDRNFGGDVFGAEPVNFR